MLAFKVFDEVYLLTGGGPGTSTEVVSFTLYQRFFTEDRVGYGSAMSIVVIFFVSLLLVIALSARRRTEGADMNALAACRRGLVARLCRARDRGARSWSVPVIWVIAAGFRTQISLLMGAVLLHARC